MKTLIFILCLAALLASEVGIAAGEKTCAQLFAEREAIGKKALTLLEAIQADGPPKRNDPRLNEFVELGQEYAATDDQFINSGCEK